MKFENNILTKGKFIKTNEFFNSEIKEYSEIGIIDSKSISKHNVFEKKGFDGNKKIKGIKLNIIVKKNGFILDLTVTPANIHDTLGRLNVAENCIKKNPNIKILIANKGYRGTFYDYFSFEKNIKVDIDKQKSNGFFINGICWVVE